MELIIPSILFDWCQKDRTDKLLGYYIFGWDKKFVTPRNNGRRPRCYMPLFIPRLAESM